MEEVVTRKTLLDGGTVWEQLTPKECDSVLSFSPGGRFASIALVDGGVAVWTLEPVVHLALVLPAPSQPTSR